MAAEIKDNDEKLAKAKVIDGMLTELDMSKQELIDLIKMLTEQSLSEDKEQGVSQNVNDIELKDLSPDSENLGTLTLEQLASEIANGNIKYLARFLSLEHLNKLSMRVGLAFALKRAKELGIVPDMEKISQMVGIAGVKSISPNNTINANGKDQALSSSQANKIGADLGSVINSRQASKNSFRGQQVLIQNAQAINDPNDLNNQNSSVNIVRRVVSMIAMQIQSLGGGSANLSMATASNPALQQQQQQQQQIKEIQRAARRMERINAQMRKNQNSLKKTLPNVAGSYRRAGQTYVMVNTSRGAKEVKLEDFLKDNKVSSPKIIKNLNDLARAREQLEQNFTQLTRGVPDAKAFQFNNSGKLQVVIESEKGPRTQDIVDRINDLQREVDKLKGKAEVKKQEYQVKVAEVEKPSNIQRAKDLTRGPELDNASAEAAKMAAERAQAMKLIHSDVKAPNQNEVVERKEVKRVGDELIKLDELHDNQKMMESLKATGEMKSIESSMKDVMKHMEEAEKNKDLLKEIHLSKKDKFVDKI